MATTRRSIQCGPNSRPGLPVSRASRRVRLDETVHPLGAEQRLSHRDREVDEDAPFLAGARRRFDGLHAVLHVRLVVHVAGERKQVVALQPVHRGQQPVCVTMALALHEVDGDQQIQLGQRVVQLGAVGPGDDRIASS